MAATFSRSPANGIRRHCAKGATIWKRTCASSRRRTRPSSEREGIMALKVYALTCGWLEGDFGRLMESGEGRIRLPIPSYLIEHPKGTALFDTGMHRDCQHDPAARGCGPIAPPLAIAHPSG